MISGQSRDSGARRFASRLPLTLPLPRGETVSEHLSTGSASLRTSVVLVHAMVHLWFMGIAILTGPSLHHMDFSGVAPFLISFGFVATAAAVTAWLGKRRWWIWQAAAVGLPVVTIIGLMLWVNLF